MPKCPGLGHKFAAGQAVRVGRKCGVSCLCSLSKVPELVPQGRPAKKKQKGAAMLTRVREFDFLRDSIKRHRSPNACLLSRARPF